MPTVDAVGLDPDGARVFAVDFHEALAGAVLARFAAEHRKPVIQRALLLAAPVPIIQGRSDVVGGEEPKWRLTTRPNTTTARACRSIREIFARWQRDAAAYRERMKAEENAELGLAYGASPRQNVDLFFPDATGHTPLALFIHGGYWRSLEASTFSHISAGLNARGVAVAVAGYDLCPQVTIVQIINQIRTACLFLWRRFGQRLMVYGHSAGGHLAACMVATDWKKLDPKAPRRSGAGRLFDLRPVRPEAAGRDRR